MKIRNLFLTIMSLAMLSSCEMMKEDADDTYCGVFIGFKYDYNLQRADMFKDHVGGVTLYVFDSNGRFVRSYERNDVPQMGTMLLDGTYAYCMQINDLPDGDYRFIALANQKAYAATLGTPGAKYRRSTLVDGDSNESLTVTLDRETPVYGGGAVVSSEAPLDTLWHAMSGNEVVTVKNNTGKLTTTLSLVRDTKMLTIGLHNLDEDSRTNISADEFEFYITDRNGKLAYNNDLLDDEKLVYNPFHTWDTQTVETDGTVVDKTAHASIAFNRLVVHENLADDAILTIRNKEKNEVVAVIDLAQFLAQGANAIDTYRYGYQEFLDRGYDFYMDFFFKGGEWQKDVQMHLNIGINVLSWARRIQNEDLGKGM